MLYLGLSRKYSLRTRGRTKSRFDSYRSEKWFECLTKGCTGSGDIDDDEYPDKMDWGISLDSFYEEMVNSSDILMWYDRFQLEKEALRLLPMPPGLSLM
jgi:hypothetical protein